ncbi:MAG TPA: type II secretion system F family protein [Candidatus Thermoplasmatota archaeon]|nr:type II secretion system F family protein [Candidatus Thermoplasmatota archaeon]
MRPLALNEFQRLSYKLLGASLRDRLSSPDFEESVRRSNLGVRAEAYHATALLTAILVTAGAYVFSLFLGYVLMPAMGQSLPLLGIIATFTVPLLMGAGTYAAMITVPASRAKARAKDINAKLPYALNYIAAMSSAGVNIDRLFYSLSKQKIYGEVAKEAGRIYCDMAFFGRDSVTAMHRAIQRTPSDKMQEFLQGAITTVTSGGNLQTYFSTKAQKYMWENRQEQKAFVDMMGLMAETYVTAAVAGPLFLIIMLAIMGMLGGGGPQQLFLVVYLMLPVVNFGFVFLLSSMTPEV